MLLSVAIAVATLPVALSWSIAGPAAAIGREHPARRTAPGGMTNRQHDRADERSPSSGSRGIPPAYGGFETMAWELSRELAARGHEVTVYSYRGRTDETRTLPPGVRRRWVRGLRGKHLETVTHTAMGALDTVLHRYDAVLLVNAANALVAFLPRLRGAKVALNVDGIERQRAKWGLAGRLWYTLGERLSLYLPNVIVADAQVIADYYRERYGRETALIAYGATLLDRDPPPDLARHGLPADVQPGRYLLYVSRLEPENQADLVIRAYADVPGERAAAHRRRRALRDRVQGPAGPPGGRRPARAPDRRPVRRGLHGPPARAPWPTSRPPRWAARTPRSSSPWPPATSSSPSARRRTARSPRARRSSSTTRHS